MIYTYGNTLIDGNVAYAQEVKDEFQAVETAFTAVNIDSISFDSVSSTITINFEDASSQSVGIAAVKGTNNGADEAFAFYLGTMR